MLVAAKSKQIKQDMLNNPKTKNQLTENQIEMVAQNAVLKTIETVNNDKSNTKKRKVVEIEMSDSESESDED